MLDNVSYGPKGYAMHEESYAMENEYYNNNNHSGGMQMMPPPPQYSKQHMAHSSGIHATGASPDHGGWNNVKNNKYPNAWNNNNPNNIMHQNGWSSSSNPGHYHHHHPSGGQYPGTTTGPMMAPGRMSSSNNMKMMNAEFETYQAGPGKMRMQNYGGVQFESHDDYPNGMHNGRQKVEWKNL